MTHSIHLHGEHKRPWGMTVLAALSFIGAFEFLRGLDWPLFEYQKTIYYAAYLPLQIILFLSAAIGLWHMKKWGAICLMTSLALQYVVVLPLQFVFNPGLFTPMYQVVIFGLFALELLICFALVRIWRRGELD